MTNHSNDSAEPTFLCGRSVEAFNIHDETIEVDVRCERIGPPARPMHSEDTTFRVTLRYTDTNGSAVVVEHEADSLWDALLAARAELDGRGWLLPIAAARTDRWCVFAERRVGVAVVHPIGDTSTSEGILSLAPRDTVGLVAAQRLAYEEWLITEEARS